MTITNYKKSENTEGAIINNNGKGYIAVTCATSREFKTLKIYEQHGLLQGIITRGWQHPHKTIYSYDTDNK